LSHRHAAIKPCRRQIEKRGEFFQPPMDTDETQMGKTFYPQMTQIFTDLISYLRESAKSADPCLICVSSVSICG
jgi:hypothetical protein